MQMTATVSCLLCNGGLMRARYVRADSLVRRGAGVGAWAFVAVPAARTNTLRSHWLAGSLSTVVYS